MRGHTVLAVPVPQLDPVVRERTAFHDPSFVSRDPGFCHAHITILAPWVASVGPDDLAAVGVVAATTRPFEVRLAEIGEFPDGTIHLVPEPQGELCRLTRRIAAAFPQCPPYGGRFPGSVPHLTLDRRSGTLTSASLRRELAPLLPTTLTVDRLDLQWWANHDCRLLHTWRLG